MLVKELSSLQNVRRGDGGTIVGDGVVMGLGFVERIIKAKAKRLPYREMFSDLLTPNETRLKFSWR